MSEFNFSLTCPKCQTPLTAQDFDNNHFTIAHLQSYFQQKEAEYKQQIRQQMEQEIETLPTFQQLKSENEKLKLIVEGYKLGSTKTSKAKGEELEKYILEKLQETYNGTDEISKITHIGEKADIIHTIHKGDQQLAKIIYEIKNVDK
ncbi:5944_t:CDS:1 [Ambispora gerdemannii]|uniref:5944_t:CDS:1 n=1 Tax=Ambispora gerdemannii TaxID=144530 RepID=A0A9N8YIZ4_9GLOM|nr:5944_t:CDS:1 [Ambispora gerdemannii]